jgi:hypothetical protein
MQMRTKLAVIACAVLALLLSIAKLSATEIWYEDNNLGHGGGMPPDFIEKFQQPDSFKQATKYINVYVMRATVLQRMDDAFFTTLLLPYLQKNNIKLALNAAGGTWAGANPRRRKFFDEEIELLKRIKGLGGRVDYISLQSVLSKPLRQAGAEVEFPLEKRIDGAVDYARAAVEVFPQAQIGIIDALPTKGQDYKTAYRKLVAAMARDKIKFSYIHLDAPFDVAKNGHNGLSWDSLRDVERFVEDDLKIAFGLFATSRNGGMRSSQSYFQGTVGTLNCFSGSGGTPREYVVASWFPFPEKSIPDTATGSDYPTMRVVLEFGRRLEQIEKRRAAWVAERSNDRDWRASCGIGRSG